MTRAAARTRRCSKQGNLRRDQLPSAAAYFESRGMRLWGTGAWRTALCPLHGDTSPSLRVHLESGGWRCMSCGRHGGDLISLEMQAEGLGFIEACRRLGAWEGDHEKDRR